MVGGGTMLGVLSSSSLPFDNGSGGVAVVVVVTLTLVVAVVWSTHGGCGESGKYY